MTQRSFPFRDFIAVVDCQDADWFPSAVRFYSQVDDPLVLDATWGQGRFWSKASGLRIVGFDIQAYGSHPAPILASNEQMPFRNQSVDVVVYDPPHVHRPVDVDTSRQPQRYHLYNLKAGDIDVRRFFAEASRVLKNNGVVIAKLADSPQISRWLTIECFLAAQAASLVPFDLVIKRRALSVRNPAQRQHRARKCHAFFWVYRKP